MIYYLTAFGFVDGTFDVAEMGFVLRFVRELVEARARDAQGITEAVRVELFSSKVDDEGHVTTARPHDAAPAQDPASSSRTSSRAHPRLGASANPVRRA